MKARATYLGFSVAVVGLLLWVTPAAGATGDDAGETASTVVEGGQILAEDSDFEETDWGYKMKSLEFPTQNPSGEGWPTVIEMEGYDGANAPRPNAYFEASDGTLIAMHFGFGAENAPQPNEDYLWVDVSIRGTECSGGNFNLYDRRHAWDGHEIIEWIADQPWSNGKVGMSGSSFPGQTAYWVATTQPPSLETVSANLIHADIYRDIFRPGGVENILFPSLWTYATGPQRVPEDAIDDGEGFFAEDEICQQNQATRYDHEDPWQPQQEPIWAVHSTTDNDWYRAHAARTYADLIDIPYYQQANFHDEQVGPRGIVMWNYIDPEPREIPVCGAPGETKTVEPKQFVIGSGDHGWGEFEERDLWPWMDMWLRGECDRENILDHTMEVYFETRTDDEPAHYTTVKHGDEWPFNDTEWERVYLHEDGLANYQKPSGPEETDTYVSAVPRGNWFWEDPHLGEEVRTANGPPTKLVYETPALEERKVVAGPVLFNLWASMTGTDTDFYVAISDVYPDGKSHLVQRGLLKASHRSISEEQSFYTDEGRLYQPFRPHSNPQQVTPGEVENYKIEVFPTGHIFREDHNIRIEIHVPPAVEGLWGYTPTRHDPAEVTVHHDAQHPSWLQLPLVEPNPYPGDEWALEEPPEGCGVPGGFPCSPPSPLSVG